MEYSCRMREVGYTSTKLLSVHVRIFCQSLWETRSESAHGHCLVGFIFQVRNSRHSLFFCWRLSNSVALLQSPLLDWGWIACIRRKASCIEPRVYRVCVPCVHIRVYRICVPWRFRTNMCTVPPLIYISKKTYYQKYNFWFNIIWKYNTIFFVYIYFTVFFTQYFFFVLYFFFQFYIQFASPI